MTSNQVHESKGRKFDPTIYVKWENLDDTDPYLGTFDAKEDALESGETVYVAEYKLVKVHKGTLLPQFK